MNEQTSGLAWKLQGVYERTAQRFIDAGLIHRADQSTAQKEEGRVS